MKNSKKIWLALAIALMVTVSGQAATSMYFGDTSGNSLPSAAIGDTVCVWLAATPDNGTVFEAMLGYDTTAATTYGAAARANTQALDVSGVTVNATLFPDIDTNVPRLIKNDVAAREESNAALSGRPWGKKIVGGLKNGFAAIPGTAQELCRFVVAGTGDGSIVLSTATGTSYASAWKMGTTSYPCSAVLPIAGAVTPPVLQSAVSRKAHTGVGDFDIPLALAGTSVECRNGGPTKVIMTFDAPVSKDAGFAVTLSSGTLGTTTAAGNTLEINLTGATDKAWLAIGVTGLSGGTYNLTVGSLYCDVNYSKGVSATDIVLVKSKSAAAVDATTFKYDVNCSGTITATDIVLVKSKSGNVLP